MIEDMRDIERELSALREVNLTPDEKRRMRNVLRAYMNAHPGAKIQIQSVPSPLSYWFVMVSRTSAMACAVIFVVGSVSYAARGSLPGQALYPVKVGFNEKVQSMLTLSPEASATLAVDQAAQRLAEIETLASTGKLDSVTQAQAEKRFEESFAEASKRVDTLKASGNILMAAAVSEDLESKLDTHLGAIAGIAETSQSREAVANIAYSVKSKLDDAAVRSIELGKTKVKLADRGSAESIVRTAQDSAITLLIENARDSQSAQAENTSDKGVATMAMTARTMAAPEPSAKLMAKGASNSSKEGVSDAVQKLIDQGKEKYAKGEYADAYENFKKAQRLAKDDTLLRGIAGDLKSLADKKKRTDEATTTKGVKEDDHEGDDDSHKGSDRGGLLRRIGL